MRLFSFIFVILIFVIASCKAPLPEGPATTSAPTQGEVLLAATALPPTEPAVPQGKLPAAPFESQAYINEQAGFALDYPTGWTVNETVVGPRGTQIQFLSSPALAEAATVPEGETRLSAVIYQWDPKNDLAAYAQHMKEAWTSSGFTILDEEQLTLELGLPAVLYTVQTPDTQVVYLVTALQDQYLVVAGEGNLELVRQIVERLRPIS